MKKRIAEAWASFEEVLSEQAGPLQRKEMRRAFYAGANALYHLMLQGVSDSPEFTQEDQDLGDAIEAEFAEFVADVRTGKA
jgi:hypothetical protein